MTQSTRTEPSKEEAVIIGMQADKLYAEHIRDMVYRDENIGKMVIIDVDSGDYELDSSGVVAANKLYDRHPQAKLYGIRVGYRTADTIGGVRERI